MKKLIAILMVVLMLAAMPVAASAATTTLTTNVPEATYTMNIPADMEIPFGAESTKIGTVTITDANGFAVGKNVYVKVEYDGTFKADGISTIIPYTMSKYGSNGETTGFEDQDLLSEEYLTFEGQETGGVNAFFELTKGAGAYSSYSLNQTLRININSADWGKALGGEYKTTITFTAQVANEEPTA